MKNNHSSYYRNVPGGSGINPNIRGEMVAVTLDDMVDTGSRTQRRWALKELRKLAREALRETRKSVGRSA
ncbi:MAG: hypothetical protein Q8O38_10700 [Sulfurimicrobium sp.]|nr:hypothetical protein [Sulfurimicrobium sp.]